MRERKKEFRLFFYFFSCAKKHLKKNAIVILRRRIHAHQEAICPVGPDELLPAAPCRPRFRPSFLSGWHREALDRNAARTAAAGGAPPEGPPGERGSRSSRRAASTPPRGGERAFDRSPRSPGVGEWRRREGAGARLSRLARAAAAAAAAAVAAAAAAAEPSTPLGSPLERAVEPPERQERPVRRLRGILPGAFRCGRGRGRRRLAQEAERPPVPRDEPERLEGVGLGSGGGLLPALAPPPPALDQQPRREPRGCEAAGKRGQSRVCSDDPSLSPSPLHAREEPLPQEGAEVGGRGVLPPTLCFSFSFFFFFAAEKEASSFSTAASTFPLLQSTSARRYVLSGPGRSFRAASEASGSLLERMRAFLESFFLV